MVADIRMQLLASAKAKMPVVVSLFGHGCVARCGAVEVADSELLVAPHTHKLHGTCSKSGSCIHKNWVFVFDDNCRELRNLHP